MTKGKVAAYFRPRGLKTFKPKNVGMAKAHASSAVALDSDSI